MAVVSSAAFFLVSIDLEEIACVLRLVGRVCLYPTTV